MAVTGGTSVGPPNAYNLLTPVLPALAVAAVSNEPPVGILPLLSPIMRQRVRFLAASSSDSWLRLLCYDSSKGAKLGEVVTNGALEPHPVSGEVEIDWDYDSETRYRRLDSETLQAFVVLARLGLAFNLVHCPDDNEGSSDGWRIGEVTVPDSSSPFDTFGGSSTISEAEQLYKNKQQPQALNGHTTNGPTSLKPTATYEAEDEEDDDDDYWARYDATPARTPAQKHSPAPQSTTSKPVHEASAEDTYFAQYNDVQPAMDNYDPGEDTHEPEMPPPLGLNGSSRDQPSAASIGVVDAASDTAEPSHHSGAIHEGLLHPRPESSASSSGSQTVAKLEEQAGRQANSEFGVKQHVSRTIRSLFMLSRASGISREEFEGIVKDELDVLGMMDEVE